MEKYRVFELDEALLVAGNSIATNQTISDIKTLRTRACEAQSALDDIEIKDVYDFGCVDELVRLKRNAAALATLLSMAADAAEYVKYGIHAIFQAHDAHDKQENARRQLAIAREEEYRRNKQKMDKLRAKQKEPDKE